MGWACTPRGEYPGDWAEIAAAVKEAAGWRCVRCGHPHSREGWRILTVHHLSGDKADVRWFNLVALCQRCHLRVQGKVDLERPWVLDHSEWFQPYVAGYYAAKYLGLELTRAEVESNLDYYLSLERQAVLG